MVYKGFHRAKVINANDPQQYGRVQVWIPDLMQKVSDKTGLWASPANNPISGLNSDGNPEHWYMGSSYIPQKGSWVVIFFENGRPERPFYLCGLDLKNSKVLPENRVGSLPHRKWVIFKSNKGRSIVVSDDPDDERVQITGLKRLLSSPPSGDTASVSTIEGNQTTILLSEKSGEQQILIKTYLGDYIKVDIEKRTLTTNFKESISTESTDSTITTKAKQAISTTSTDSTITTLAKGNITTTSQTGDIIEIATVGNIYKQAGGAISLTSPSDISFNSPDVHVNGNLKVSTGADGNFVSLDGRMVTVVKGIVTEIT